MKLKIELTDLNFFSYNVFEAGLRKLDIPVEKCDCFSCEIGPIYVEENQCLVLLNYLKTFEREVAPIPIYDSWFILRKHYVGIYLPIIVAKYNSLLQK